MMMTTKSSFSQPVPQIKHLSKMMFEIKQLYHQVFPPIIINHQLWSGNYLSQILNKIPREFLGKTILMKATALYFVPNIVK